MAQLSTDAILWDFGIEAVKAAANPDPAIIGEWASQYPELEHDFEELFIQLHIRQRDEE